MPTCVELERWPQAPIFPGLCMTKYVCVQACMCAVGGIRGTEKRRGQWDRISDALTLSLKALEPP